MENKLVMVIGVLLAVLCLGASGMSVPTDDQNEIQGSRDDGRDEDIRATWLETRENDLQDVFKDLVYLSLQELEKEGKIKPTANGSAKEKRGRWQGFCFRRTRSGRFLPYICWKGAGKNNGLPVSSKKVKALDKLEQGILDRRNENSATVEKLQHLQYRTGIPPAKPSPVEEEEASLESTIEELEQEIEEYKQEMSDLKSRNEEMHKENVVLAETIEKMATENKKLREDIGLLKDSRNKLRAKLVQLRKSKQNRYGSRKGNATS